MHRRAQLTYTNIHRDDFSRDACIRDDIPNVFIASALKIQVSGTCSMLSMYFMSYM